MSGVSAILLQAVIVLLLYRTYSIQRATERRSGFEGKFFALFQRYEDSVRQLQFDDSNGSYSLSIERKTYKDRQAFIVYKSILLNLISAENSFSDVKSWFNDNDDEVGNWRRALYLLVNQIRESEKLGTVIGSDYLNVLRGALSLSEAQVLLLYLVKFESPGESETAKYLLRKNFFLYSNAKVAFGSHFPSINDSIYRLHGMHIYRHDVDDLTKE